ncbi:MAG: DUF1854 domain-containing protein [Candidatus Bathyarchaeota archaeon]|jgi:hypothetical protein|nr:DUF1854 domain-containing protein [Candidatus Bathyarchaeota archaeon]
MSTKSLSTRILEPNIMRIFKDESGDLQLRIKDETEHRIQKILRVFPITMPWNYIVFKDAEDKEIGVLRNVNELDSESARVLKEELEKVYFIPRITKIYDIKEEFGVLVWKTETDKGPRRFDVINRREVKKISRDRILIKDGDGNLYDIPDFKKLDQRSLVLLDSAI